MHTHFQEAGSVQSLAESAQDQAALNGDAAGAMNMCHPAIQAQAAQAAAAAAHMERCAAFHVPVWVCGCVAVWVCCRCLVSRV